MCEIVPERIVLKEVFLSQSKLDELLIRLGSESKADGTRVTSVTDDKLFSLQLEIITLKQLA